MDTEIGPDLAPPLALQDGGPMVKIQDDYFAFEIMGRTMFPDGISWVEHAVMNEGARRKYLKAVNREVRVQKTTQDAILNMSPGEERTELLRSTIVGWNLARGGERIPFTTQNLNEFLVKADPKVINLIDKDVRLANPWLLNEMSIEDIDREIAELGELRAKKVEEEEGKGTSNNR